MPVNRAASMEVLARDPLSGDSFAKELGRLRVKRRQNLGVFVYAVPYQPIDKLRIARRPKLRLKIGTRMVDGVCYSTEGRSRRSTCVHK
jgi:hypothetical protein